MFYHKIRFYYLISMDEPSRFEKIVSTPAVALDKTVAASKKITSGITSHSTLRKAEAYWHNLGPGLTTGAADDDPSGIATYSEAGAKYGFQLLWLASFTFPLMALVQEMCARIGLVTGQGLAGNIKDRFPRWVLYLCTLLLFAANTFNISADLGAMAAATRLLWPSVSAAWLVIAFTAVSLMLQIFTSYKEYAKYLKWLALILLSYVFSALLVDLDFSELWRSAFWPTLRFTKDEIILITAILGTTISPYLFFWQTSQEIEEEVMAGKKSLRSRRGSSPEEIKKMRIDVWSGMFISNVVMFFIIATCAATLNQAGITDIKTAADAAMALRPLAGEWAFLLFTLGIIGTGMLAIPILAGSVSYAIAEMFNWRAGLYRKLSDAYAFYGVIIISMFLGVALNFLRIDPIHALIYAAVANGLVAPFIIVLIVILSSNRAIMGEWTSKPATTFFGWFLAGLMSLAGIATIISIL